MSEDNKELISELKKLRNSIDKLTILFEFVKKELIEDYDKKDNSEALLKKLLNQNQVIAQGMVKLSDSVNNYSNQQPQKTQNNFNNLQNKPQTPPQTTNVPPPSTNQQPKGNMPPPPANQQTAPPQMDFTNFKSLNDTKKTNNSSPGLDQKIPEPKEEKKGFLGMFKK